MLNFAFDLGTALDIVAGVRLGPGNISVHPAKLGVVGHGFGGSAAVFAAAGMAGQAGLPMAVVSIFPTVTSPPAEQPAATLQGPGFDLDRAGGSEDVEFQRAWRFPRAWDAATLRIVSKAESGGLVEGRRLTKVFGLAGPHRRTQRTVRALLTGYLLVHAGRRQNLSRLRRS